MTAPSPDPTPAAAPGSILGWREWVALPLLGVPLIKAKVDTGARSCALHAFELEEFQRDGVRWVRFTVHPRQDNDERSVRVECEVLCERSIRSSAGQVEVRPVVRTEILLGRRRMPVDLTLTNRDTMGFRMLLGRSAIRGQFVVDPSRSFVQRRPRPGRRGTARARPAAPDAPKATDTSPPQSPSPPPAANPERTRA